MSLTEEQIARMERMKKVAQEKKKWKEKAALSGSSGGKSGPPSGGQVLYNSGGSGVALQAGQIGGPGVPISQSGQGGGVLKTPVVVERVLQQGVTSSVALHHNSSSTATTRDISSGVGIASSSSSSSSGISNYHSSLAGRPAPTFCGGSVATKPASAFYKPQAAPPPLPRGNFRPQEQPSTFKHQAPSKV